MQRGVLVGSPSNKIHYGKRVTLSIIGHLARPIQIEGKVCQVTASIGISYWSADDSANLDEKINQVDSNMYIAKRSG